jgi:uncharacterized oligopeptide transporter (OPT) family protein
MDYRVSERLILTLTAAGALLGLLAGIAVVGWWMTGWGLFR